MSHANEWPLFILYMLTPLYSMLQPYKSNGTDTIPALAYGWIIITIPQPGQKFWPHKCEELKVKKRNSRVTQLHSGLSALSGMVK